MAIPSGLSSQIGIVPEVTYGTYVIPTRFLEFTSESLTVDKRVLESRSIGSMFLKSGRVRHYIRGGGGQIEVPFMNQGMGLLLKHALGGAAIAQVAATPEYEQTFTPAADGGQGDYLTVQKGLADTGGTVRPFNYLGMKVTEWELAQAIDANLLFRLTMDAKTVEVASALATASYPADLVPLSFIDAVLTIDAVEVCVREFTITGTRAMDLERICLGNTKREPVANGEFVIGGTIVREFEGMDQYNDWIAGTPAALTATWEYGDTGDGQPFALEITIPHVIYTGETPQANGSEITLQNLPFKALDNGTDPVITIVYSSTDTAY
jgi:hypothetical protein